ncbi:MAG: ADP-ribosylglycohydrolase family protein [Candidatus Hydrogenedentes bacterium]|nr:ADP-ribosylglycohydrolase family protein [Candidatus Hydrogenedentota bacterium]
MRFLIPLLLLTILLSPIAGSQTDPYLRLPVHAYLDKMKAGWVGQMAGVGWGGPTEFRFNGVIMPAPEMPEWRPEMVNQFMQDDLYVEMTFLRTLEMHGLDAPTRQAGIDFANSGYKLWHANRAGRDNLRNGIAPPDSGHPSFNSHADDIDYQIEADFSGLIAPGMPNTVIELGEKFGRLMNYGDGLYGGLFVGGMYAAAFFETDIEAIVRAGLACIPEGSQYHACISDVLRWHQEDPEHWEATWQRISEKYHLNREFRRFSCSKPDDAFNIDAKINGAYIVMGLLYGKGDIDQTVIIATRCGQDSDCNPSNAAGVLFTTLGFSQLPGRFTEALDPEGTFSHTPYNFPKLIDVCGQLARQAVVRAGGTIETNFEGDEEFVIPRREPSPPPLEQCWEPRPPADSRFTDAQKARINPPKESD